MDKRLKPNDHIAQTEALHKTVSGIVHNDFDLAGAVLAMRRASLLTQPEFAKHRGISLAALRQIERGTGNPTVASLNKIASIFGLEVGFVRKKVRPIKASKPSSNT